MRRRLYTGTFLACLILFVVSCASTPTNRWAQARVTLTTGQNTALTLHEAGIIDDLMLVKADPYVKSARVALDAAEGYLPEGGDTFEILMDAAIAAITYLETQNTGVPE